MVEPRIKFREAWLHEATDRFIRKHFAGAGYTVPEKLRLTCGWPAKGGLARKKRVIGQAWSYTASKDGVAEIFISPTLADPIRVLDVLIHEIVHATVGNDAKHGKPFVDCTKAVGLTGKPTATVASDELRGILEGWVERLGPYPHAELDGNDLPKQSTRLLLMECDCGLKIRTTQKWVDEYGTSWPCPCNGTLEYQES